MKVPTMPYVEATLWPYDYADGLRFVMICCGLRMIDFTHAIQAYFTSTNENI